jgi:hypothetical protein
MKNKYFLFILVALLSITDAVCTILNANPGYWKNYNDYGNELNPLGAWALHQGPIIYFLFVAVWVLVIFVLLKYLPRKIGAWVGAAFWFGHMIGGLGTQGSYTAYDRLHIGSTDNMTILVVFMMLVTTVSTILFVYGFLKFQGYDLIQNKNIVKKTSKRKS